MVYIALMQQGRPAKSDRSDFGSRLQRLRESAGLSQRDVAAQLAITQPAYAKWERYNVGIKPEQIEQLAAVLGVSIADLFDEETASKRKGPAGKAVKVFEQVSALPRSQQQKILETVEMLLAGTHAKQGT
jgi:transcriptional regulator with XRE-family HTH domain